MLEKRNYLYSPSFPFFKKELKRKKNNDGYFFFFPRKPELCILQRPTPGAGGHVMVHAYLCLHMYVVIMIPGGVLKSFDSNCHFNEI